MVKKTILHDRSPYVYAKLSHDSKEGKYYGLNRSGGPGSPAGKYKELTEEEARKAVQNKHPAFDREVVDKKHYEFLKEHQKPEWKEK